VPEVFADQQTEARAAGLAVGTVERRERQPLAFAEEAASWKMRTTAGRSCDG
jgi:hypothetical protein